MPSTMLTARIVLRYSQDDTKKLPSSPPQRNPYYRAGFICDDFHIDHLEQHTADEHLSALVQSLPLYKQHDKRPAMKSADWWYLTAKGCQEASEWTPATHASFNRSTSCIHLVPKDGPLQSLIEVIFKTIISTGNLVLSVQDSLDDSGQRSDGDLSVVVSHPATDTSEVTLPFEGLNLGNTQTTWAGLGIPARLASALSKYGYDSPTEIQLKAFSAILRGQSVILKSPPGTGKTMAYALPAVMKVFQDFNFSSASLDISGFRPSVVIVTPTKLLALQIGEVFQDLLYDRFLQAHVLESASQRLASERSTRADVLVGTLGDLRDALQQQIWSSQNLASLVIDEAPEVLKRNGSRSCSDFVQMMTPSDEVNPELQVVLASASIQDSYELRVAFDLLDPSLITTKSTSFLSNSLQTNFYEAKRPLREIVRHVIGRDGQSSLIFLQDHEVGPCHDLLGKNTIQPVSTFPVDCTFSNAARVLPSSAPGIILLAASQRAYHGLNFQHISTVYISFLPPVEEYIHMVGRTARRGSIGEAFIFYTAKDAQSSLLDELKMVVAEG